MEQIGNQLWVITGAISLDLFDNELGASFHEELSDPRDKAVLNPKSRASYSAMLLVALKSRCTMYLIWSPCGARSTTPALPPCLREEPSKKRVQWASEDWSSGLWLTVIWAPGGLADGVQLTMKSANTWLLTALRGMNSSSNSANSTAYLAILSVVLGLRRMAHAVVYIFVVPFFPLSNHDFCFPARVVQHVPIFSAQYV
jgi:hypothetical protein